PTGPTLILAPRYAFAQRLRRPQVRMRVFREAGASEVPPRLRTDCEGRVRPEPPASAGFLLSATPEPCAPSPFLRWVVRGAAKELDRPARDVLHLLLPLSRPAGETHGVVRERSDRHRGEECREKGVGARVRDDQQQQRGHHEEDAEQQPRRSIALPG